jgi:hypothetical protein
MPFALKLMRDDVLTFSIYRQESGGVPLWDEI